MAVPVKIFLMVILVTALKHGEAQTCRTRSAFAEMTKMRATTRCSKPQESLVQLPVPEGYDYVRPSVAKLKQCSGLSCQVFPDKCFPDPNSITTKTISVFAFSVDDHNPNCVEVEVEEHGDCQCRCEVVECPPSQVFNKETCQCECDPDKEAQCEQLRRKLNILTQWSEKTCSCICLRPEECATDMTWVQELCRCIRTLEGQTGYHDYLNFIDY